MAINNHFVRYSYKIKFEFNFICFKLAGNEEGTYS
jgi:hypothetical protein